MSPPAVFSVSTESVSVLLLVTTWLATVPAAARLPIVVLWPNRSRVPIWPAEPITTEAPVPPSAVEEASLTVPRWIEVVPPKELLPPRVRVAEPLMVKAPDPEMALLKTAVPERLMTSVPLLVTALLAEIEPVVPPAPIWRVAPAAMVVAPV